MKKYVLEDYRENTRLENQAKLKHYSLEQELEHISFHGKEVVLDAGCGTGLFGRYLRERFPEIRYTGADLSSERLEEARKSNPADFNFTTLDLFKSDDFSPYRGKVDFVFNRYVMHHLRNHTDVLRNFHEVLAPNGKVCIVDIDGIFLNVGTTNKHLQESINLIAANFGGDLCVGRYLPKMLKEVGFREISWKIQLMDFQGEARKDEVEQFRERLEFGKKSFAQILGSEMAYHRFVKAYLAELASPETSVFYNKFIIQAVK